MEYVRSYYKVPAKRGGRVVWRTSNGVRAGRIVRATHYVWVLFDDAARSAPLYPGDPNLVYLDGQP